MRINYIMLSGYVDSRITLVELADGDWAAKVMLKVLRPELAKKVENITVYFKSAQQILDEVEEGDFLEIEGHIETINYKKELVYVCERCGQKTIYQKDDGEELFVFGDKFRRIECENVLSDTINTAIMLGEICTDSNYYNGGAKPYNKFKIAINRYGKPSFRYVDGVETMIKADFPYIVTFGKQADRAKIEVQKGAYIAVKGVVQERTFTRKIDVECEHCNLVSKLEQTETVREIIASNTEYFKDRKPTSKDDEYEV